MSGQRNYIYLNKKPRRPDDWRAINCKTLDITVKVYVGAILLVVGGLLLWSLM